VSSMVPPWVRPYSMPLPRVRAFMSQQTTKPPGKRARRTETSTSLPAAFRYADPAYCRVCAQEIRRIAERMQDIETKAILEDLAECYLRLAERAEMRGDGRQRPK
jgi:hypothetical protein